MASHLSEHALHDSINLARLARRLKQSSKEIERSLTTDTWIQAQCTLQKVKYARELLITVEQDDSMNASRYQNMRASLDDVESHARNIEKKSAPRRTKPPSLLSSIPLPAPVEPSPSATPGASAELSILDSAADDLLLSPSESTPFPSVDSPRVFLPPKPVPAAASKSTTTAAPKLLQNSNAVQQELSDQLAQMAAQLKRNAVHFAQSLEEDQAVVEDTQVKLEGNYDVMLKERLRLRDHRGKSGSTTCIVFFSMFVVSVSFVIMIYVIRLT